MACAWILNPKRRSHEKASRMRPTEMPRSLRSRMRWQVLWTPICTFVAPMRRMRASDAGETASGRVSITRPTTRCAAVSLARCARSRSAMSATCQRAAAHHAGLAPYSSRTAPL